VFALMGYQMSDAAQQFGLLLAPYFAALLLTGGA
jgi:hypothetical protein